MVAICSGTESSEDDEDYGGHQQGVCAGPFVAEIAEEQLPDNRADKCNGRDILLRTGLRIRLAIDDPEKGGHGADNLHGEHIRHEDLRFEVTPGPFTLLM